MCEGLVIEFHSSDFQGMVIEFHSYACNVISVCFTGLGYYYSNVICSKSESSDCKALILDDTYFGEGSTLLGERPVREAHNCEGQRHLFFPRSLSGTTEGSQK